MAATPERRSVETAPMRMFFRSVRWRAALLCAVALSAAPHAAAFEAAHLEWLMATKACDNCDLSGADLEKAADARN